MSLPYPATGSSTTRVPAEPTWGLPDAFGGWFVAYLGANVVGAVVYLAGGFQTTAEIKAAPLGWTMAAALPIWLAFTAVVVVVGNRKGNGWIRDFRVSFRPVDLLIGIPAGVVAQLVLVPLVSFPILRLSGQDADDLAEPARNLADKVHGAGGALLLLLVVGVIAPLAEELFFRGLLFRSIEKKWSAWWALGLSSAFFAATHFQPLQFLPLLAAGAVFGSSMMVTCRLGTAAVTHMAFNITTVVLLLWMT